MSKRNDNSNPRGQKMDRRKTRVCKKCGGSGTVHVPAMGFGQFRTAAHTTNCNSCQGRGRR